MNSSKVTQQNDGVATKKMKVANKVLNTNALEQSLWLVKVPSFVAERWSRAENDEILGSLTVSQKSSGPNLPPSKQLNVLLEKVDGATGPDSFTLEELKSSNDSFVAFSTETDPTKGFSIDGKVTKNMLLKPHINEEYRKLIRDRGLSKVVARKQIGMANVHDIERTATQSHTVEFIASDRMELKRRAAAEKLSSKSSRLSLSVGAGNLDEASEELVLAMKTRIFQAFEESERLTFKDLVQCCSEVEGFSKEKDLRDLLEIYGKYHSRGALKHFWELKPEFKDHSLSLP
jgi:hypothetical protein